MMAEKRVKSRVGMVGDGTSLGICRPCMPLKGFKQEQMSPVDLEVAGHCVKLCPRESHKSGLLLSPAT